MSSGWREAGRAMNPIEDAPIVHQLMAVEKRRPAMFFTACKVFLRPSADWEVTEAQITCLRCLVDYVLLI